MEIYFTGIHMPNHVQLFISPPVIYLALLYNLFFRYFQYLPLYCYSSFLQYRFADSFTYIFFLFDISFRSLSFTVHCFFPNFTLSDFRFWISPLHPYHFSWPFFLIATVASGGPHKVNCGQKPFRVHYSWNQETKSHASREPNPRVHHSGQVTCSLCWMWLANGVPHSYPQNTVTETDYNTSVAEMIRYHNRQPWGTSVTEK
jgi:hypothetical protein